MKGLALFTSEKNTLFTLGWDLQEQVLIMTTERSVLKELSTFVVLLSDYPSNHQIGNKIFFHFIFCRSTLDKDIKKRFS